MGYKRYKMLQKYVNGVATEEYVQGDLISESEYSTYDVCMEGNEKPDVPVIDTIYQWVNDGTTCDGWSKYKLEKQQKSTDGGVTWTDTGATRKGDLVASCSDDCGAVITEKSISNCSYDITASSLTKQWGSSICVNLDITLRNATGVKTFISTIRNKDITGSTVDWINYETISTQGGNIWCFDLNEITEDKECEIVWRIDDKYTLVQDLTVKTNQRDYSSQYLTIEALTRGTLLMWANNTSVAKTISYSTDGGSNWTNFTTSRSEYSFGTLNVGDKILFKGVNASYGDFNKKNQFGGTAQFKVYGNIMSLIVGDNFETATTLDSVGYNFYKLFYETNVVNAENLILPATTLAEHCYDSMFVDCTSLTQAPSILPATTLANRCYWYMFYGCTSLTTAPQLPATTLATYCYDSMFRGCTSLTTAPSILPATTLAYACCQYMFNGCTSLTTAPQLPATTLAEYCCQYMFEGCTSLTTAPSILPATTLAEFCYEEMFYGCRSLTTAPELPATTLVRRCYNSMFEGCRSLNYVKCLATDISASLCISNWLFDVSATGTFVKVHGVEYDTDDIPSTWTVEEI